VYEYNKKPISSKCTTGFLIYIPTCWENKKQSLLHLFPSVNLIPHSPAIVIDIRKNNS
jgi:hypothetical protein